MAHPQGREAPTDPLSEEARAGGESGADASEALVSGLEALARRVQAAALARDATIGTAESCTGGLVGHCLTQVAGSSAYYRGGVVSYADDVKVELLAVPRASIERHGAVSAQVAVAMAEGVRSRVGAAFGLAVTGIAGPDGGSEAKPVGLTYVAAAGPAGHTVRRFVWDGSRAANKDASARAVLELAVAVLEDDVNPG